METAAANNIVSKFVVAHLGVPPMFYASMRFAVVLIAVFPWLRNAPRPLPCDDDVMLVDERHAFDREAHAVLLTSLRSTATVASSCGRP